jgi:hypothetical protein
MGRTERINTFLLSTLISSPFQFTTIASTTIATVCRMTPHLSRFPKSTFLLFSLVSSFSYRQLWRGLQTLCQ